MMCNDLLPKEKKKYNRLAAEFERLNDKSRDFLERYIGLLAELYGKTGRTRLKGGRRPEKAD
jgi:hypothetical protein